MPNYNLSRTNNADARGVRELQEALNNKGANLYVDGRFARGTDIALAQFQQENKLEVTGVADEATWAKLLGKKAPAKKPAAKKTPAKKPAAKKAPAKKSTPAKKKTTSPKASKK